MQAANGVPSTKMTEGALHHCAITQVPSMLENHPSLQHETGRIEMYIHEKESSLRAPYCEAKNRTSRAADV